MAQYLMIVNNYRIEVTGDCSQKEAAVTVHCFGKEGLTARLADLKNQFRISEEVAQQVRPGKGMMYLRDRLDIQKRVRDLINFALEDRLRA